MNHQEEEVQRKLATGLYVVGTPIGNLEDLGFRALRVLKQATWIAAEDTRETRKLLDHYGIHNTQLHSLHEHSTRARIDELVETLKNGSTGAYVSDAGTPGLCDPGPGLVAACVSADIPVYPVPGASALLALISVAGLAETGFVFSGFFPREKKERVEWASKARGLQYFFESPHRIKSTLEFLAVNFSNMPLVVGREITKRFETITRGNCAEVKAQIGGDEPRGEYVLALQLPAKEEASGLAEEEIRAFVKELAELGAPNKALVKAAMSHGMRKNEAYKLALEALDK